MTRVLKDLIVAPAASLLDALRVIDREGVKLVFVGDEDGRIIGTLSDGDVRRAVLRGTGLELAGAVGAAMRRDFTSVAAELTRAEALDLMRARSITQLPILDPSGRLVGLHLLQELIGPVERPNRAVIMAGGRGVRLRPLTESVPKPMLTVAGRPILERLVLHLVGSGIRDISLSINYLGHLIEEHFGDGGRFGCRISYLREERPLGTGGPLALLPPQVHPVLVMNGDLVAQPNVDAILSFHARSGRAATVCLRPYTVEVPFGVAEVQGEELVALREKPSDQLLINAGIYVFSPAALALVPKDTEYPITELLQACLQSGRGVGAHVLEGDWLDVGRHDELAKARGMG